MDDECIISRFLNSSRNTIFFATPAIMKKITVLCHNCMAPHNIFFM
jgi:hypothetical protein